MKRILLIIISGIFLIACHSTKKSTGNTNKIIESNVADLNGNWQLQMLFASDNTWQKIPFLNINLKEQTFSGNSGCNSIRGKFTIADNYFGFDKNIISTKMACLDANSNQKEKAFLSTLLKVNKYTINKDEMELGQGEIVLMKFKRIQTMLP